MSRYCREGGNTLAFDRPASGAKRDLKPSREAPIAQPDGRGLSLGHVHYVLVPARLKRDRAIRATFRPRHDPECGTKVQQASRAVAGKSLILLACSDCPVISYREPSSSARSRRPAGGGGLGRSHRVLDTARTKLRTVCGGLTCEFTRAQRLRRRCRESANRRRTHSCSECGAMRLVADRTC